MPNALAAASPLAKYLEVARRTETKYKTWEDVAEEVTKSIGSYQRPLFFVALHGGKYRECREVTDSSGVRCWCCYRPLESLIPVF